jgi:trehalose 6-phosphate phosphatase
MQVLNPHADVAAFIDRLATARERVLMLDYDGTLAPFRVRPELATPYSGVVELLDALVAQPGTRVVIVSGRRAAEVAALLPLRQSIEIWGAHGWERRDADGSTQVQEPAEDVREALALAEAGVAEVRWAGARLERKPASLAVHWRGLPVLTAAKVRAGLDNAWQPLVEKGMLEPLPFDGGLELRARGTNKQHAVKAVLSGTSPDAATAYLGDDVTDEDAFRAVKKQGLAVLVRAEYRETAADLWIRPPRELLAFMELWRRPEAGQ